MQRYIASVKKFYNEDDIKYSRHLQMSTWNNTKLGRGGSVLSKVNHEIDIKLILVEASVDNNVHKT